MKVKISTRTKQDLGCLGEELSESGRLKEVEWKWKGTLSSFSRIRGSPIWRFPASDVRQIYQAPTIFIWTRFFWLRKSRLGVQPIICWIGLYITRPAQRDRSECSGAMLILRHTVRGVLYSEAIRAITLFFYIHIISTVGAGWFYVGDSHVLRKYGSDGPRRGNCAAT
jgi:hypothetical protein